jgi:hypothetical protein
MQPPADQQRRGLRRGQREHGEQGGAIVARAGRVQCVLLQRPPGGAGAAAWMDAAAGARLATTTAIGARAR